MIKSPNKNTKKFIDETDFPSRYSRSTGSSTNNSVTPIIPPVPTSTQIQSDWIQLDNTKVDYIKNKPTVLTGDINYYINPDTGDNNHDGSSNYPFLSINHALALLPKDLNTFRVNIWLQPSLNYVEDVIVEGFHNGKMFIAGVGGHGIAPYVKITGTIPITVRNMYCYLVIWDMSLNASSTGMIIYNSQVILEYLEITKQIGSQSVKGLQIGSNSDVICVSIIDGTTDDLVDTGIVVYGGICHLNNTGNTIGKNTTPSVVDYGGLIINKAGLIPKMIPEQSTPTNAIAATGILTIDNRITVGDSMIIGTKTYNFVTNGTAANDGDIDEGTDLPSLRTNIVDAINGTDLYNNPNSDVTISNFTYSGTNALLTAIIADSAGNLLATTGNFYSTNNHFNYGNLTNGVDLTPGYEGQIMFDSGFIYIFDGLIWKKATLS